MNDERMHIFRMLANGKITAEEADRLLRAIEESKAADSSSTPSDKPRWLRIRITEDGVEKVKLNLPLSLARMGLAFLPSTAMLQINAKGIDLERLLQADLAEAGTLIELEDEGNKIEVYVE